jgi:hypothetical protein
MTPNQALRIIENAIDNSNIELEEGSELAEALNTLWYLVLLGKDKT